jgi:hypothetical protein
VYYLPEQHSATAALRDLYEVRDEFYVKRRLILVYQLLPISESTWLLNAMLFDSNAEKWICRIENNETRLYILFTKIEKKSINEMVLERI